MTDTYARLDARAWQELVLNRYPEKLSEMATRIASGYVDHLAEPLLSETHSGWRVLETGCGWGSISATLAIRGRTVTLMDWSHDIVCGGVSLLQACGAPGQGICADLTDPLPFADNSFDCVWSSGVLEHFRRGQQVQILKESARVAKHKVISLVPNALSLAYRLGKWQMERTGTWEFGYEQPTISQISLFQSVGLINVRETSVHAERSGWFLRDLPMAKYLQKTWSTLCRISPKRMDRLARQGYMLVTSGEVA